MRPFARGERYWVAAGHGRIVGQQLAMAIQVHPVQVEPNAQHLSFVSCIEVGGHGDNK